MVSDMRNYIEVSPDNTADMLSLYHENQNDINESRGVNASCHDIMEIVAVLDRQIKSGLIRSWVAYEDDLPKGMVVLDLGSPGHLRGEVRGLFVSPEARKNGMGTELIIGAASAAVQNGLLPSAALRDDNNLIQTIFHRLGWTPQATASATMHWWAPIRTQKNDSL